MLLEKAVKEGRERVGLTSDQPQLLAESLIRFWSNTVLECPDKPAFSCLGQTLSYGEVDQISRRIASYLQKELGLKAGDKLSSAKVDTVFIGSCTNGRIEDLRAAAGILKGKKIKDGLRAMIVPGSGLVRAQAEEEGLAAIFKEAGFEWRLAGCSMCLAMNPDQLAPGERCAATSNRNFEGRQGRGGRTHLMSPEMAAAAAITGRLTDVREML